MPSKPQTVASVAAEISQHEAVCAERYAGIMMRLGRLEACLLGSAGVLIMGMAALIVRGIN